MTRVCPVCSAVVGPEAGWCGLCHADLRPAGAPAVTVPGSPPARRGTSPPARRGTSPTPPGPPTPLLALPLVDPPAPPGAPRPGWPCSACSTVVPFEAQACPVCGAGFLAALTGSGLPRLPVGGSPTGGSRRGTWVAAALVLGALLLLLLPALAMAGRAAG